MSKKISIKHSHDAHELVTKFKVAAQSNGFHLVGDVHSGHFNGKGIEGRYEIYEDVVAITILKKPIFLTWTLIETKITDFFGYSLVR